MSNRHHRVIDHRHRLKVVVALCLVMLCTLSLLGYLIWTGHREEIRAAESTTRNYAAIIEARLDASLRRADGDLRALEAQIPRAALSRQAVPRYARAINTDLQERLTEFPELDAIRIFDANGEALYFSDDGPPPNTNIGDRRHFLAVKQDPRAGLVFSEVLNLRSNGRPSIFAIRALRDEQGRFRGAVVAGISFEHFQRLFKSLEIGALGAISWRRSDDQKLIMRWPEIPGLLNRPLSARNPTVQMLTTGGMTTTQHVRAETDGIMRVYSSHTLEHFPFYVGVALGLEDVLAAWRMRSVSVMLFCLLLAALLIGLMVRLWRVEDALIESEQLMSATFEQAAVGIAHIEPRTLCIMVANDHYCNLLGYTRDELAGISVRAITPPEENSARDTERAQVMAGDFRTSSSERRLVRKDGGLLWVHRCLSLVRDDAGHPLYFISVVEDISARKRVEAELEQLNTGLEMRISARTAELEAANRELASFNYAVAHDLRAPLRAINGYSAIVLADSRGRLNDTVTAHLGRIIAAGSRMGNLIDDLLALSQLTRQELRAQDIDLSKIAAAVVVSLRAADPARRATVTVQPGNIVRGDPGLLRAVMENLIGNAWKFTAKTAAAMIDIGATHCDGRTVFHVRDNGAGFDMKYAHKLFTPFQRLHHNDEFEGTGIGLATVQKIINRHAGEIWIQGAVNGGATVSFTIGAVPEGDAANAMQGPASRAFGNTSPG